jgi:hypothetical protein
VNGCNTVPNSAIPQEIIQATIAGKVARLVGIHAFFLRLLCLPLFRITRTIVGQRLIDPILFLGQKLSYLGKLQYPPLEKLVQF